MSTVGEPGDIHWHRRIDFRRIGVSYVLPLVWEKDSVADWMRKCSMAPDVKLAKQTLRKWGCRTAVLVDKPSPRGCYDVYYVVGESAPETIYFHDDRRCQHD